MTTSRATSGQKPRSAGLLRHTVGATLLALFAGTAAWGDAVDVEILRQAPKVMRYLRDKQYRNVGVLTFRFQRAGEQPSYYGSLINNNMADRWERALIASLDPENDAIQLIEEARKAAARIPNANYRTPNDRQRLFNVKYQLAAEDRFVSADAFLTGSVWVSKDLTTTTVSVGGFDKGSPDRYTQIVQFDVFTDRYVLGDLGQGFCLSKLGPKHIRGSLEERGGILAIFEQAAQQPASTRIDQPIEVTRPIEGTAAPKQKPSSTSVNSKGFPVDLVLLYDGAAQNLAPDTAFGGSCNWTLPSPEQGQKMSFNVRNLTSEKLGMVLTVNGVNTLYEQQGLEPPQMARWILEPEKQYHIQGFCQEDLKTWRPLVGLSEQDSELRIGDLGGEANAGLIHVYVFRTVQGVADAPKAQANLRRPKPVGTKGRSLSELRKQIFLADKAGPARGLVAPTDDVQLQNVEQDTLESPVLTDLTVIRYWKRSGSSNPAPATGN